MTFILQNKHIYAKNWFEEEEKNKTENPSKDALQKAESLKKNPDQTNIPTR